MKNTAKQIEPPQFLSGWKEIANYLGKGVRTVQRYEGQLGLPVRRPAGNPRGSVLATRAEIDAWVSAAPLRGAFHLTRTMPGPGAAPKVDGISAGLREMTRLREQMQSLRNELKSSLNLLHGSLQHLHGGLFERLQLEGRVEEAVSPQVDSEERARRAFALLTQKGWERKAS